MDGFTAHRYGVANPEEIARLTGKEILQAIIEGRLPHPPISEILTFWLVEIGDGFAGVRRRNGRSSPQSDGDRVWRLGHDPDRQRDRLRRLLPDAGGSRL